MVNGDAKLLFRERNSSGRSSLVQFLRMPGTISGKNEEGKKDTNLGELVNNVRTMGCGKMHFGEAAAISTVPYIEDDLLEDRHYPSYRLGTYSVMTSRKWGSLRVTTRELTDGLLANDATLSDTLAQELHNLCNLRHPQILLLMGLCPRMLVFEHIQLGSLYFYLHEKRQVPSLKSYVDILLQIVDAVTFLHGRGFIHCSLGSHAVQLVSPAIAKLGQFEYAVLDHTKETQRHTFKLLANKGWQSLYNWLSPEVLNGEPPSKRGDIFSLCSVIWELSTSLVPWQEFSPDEIVEKVVTEKAVLPLDKSTMPGHLYQLMKQGLQYSSNKRDLDLEEIRDMLLFTRREIEEDRAKRTRAITFNGEVHHLLDNQASPNGHAHHQSGYAYNQNGHAHHQNGHAHHQNGHAHHQNSHAPSRPVPIRSLSSSAIQRGSMPGTGSGRHFDKYTNNKNGETRLKRKGFLEAGSSGGYREFEVYNDNCISRDNYTSREFDIFRDGREYEVYRDGSDSSTERDYSFVTNTAKRNFLRSQPHRQKGLGRRSLTSLYHNGCDVMSVSDGLDLSSGGSSRDLSGLSGSSSSSLSSGSGGLRRRQIGRSSDSGIRVSADSGIRISADSGIRASTELGSPIRKSSDCTDNRNSLRGFKFPHTYRRKSRRPLSGLEIESNEMPSGRQQKSPDDLQPHRRSRSVPRVNQFSRPDYETAIKPASHRLERHASSHSVHSGSTHRLSSTSSTPKLSTSSTPKLSTSSQPKLSTSSQPKLSTTSQPKLSTLSQPKLSTGSQPKLSSSSAPKLSQTSQVKLLSREPKGSLDQSLAYHTAQEEVVTQPIPPPRSTIKHLQTLLLQHGTRYKPVSASPTRAQPAKPARTGSGGARGLLSSFFPHTSLLFRRSKDTEAKKDDPSVKAIVATLEQPEANDDTSPFKTANDESSKFTTANEAIFASSRYRTAADQVTELLRRPVAGNIHRSKDSEIKSALQSALQSTDSSDFTSCKQSMVVKKARYSERRQSRLDSSNLMTTNLSRVTPVDRQTDGQIPVERQTARIVAPVPQRAKLQSVEAVLHAQRTGLATSTPLNARTSESNLHNQADRQIAFNTALSQAGQSSGESSAYDTVMDASSPPHGQPASSNVRSSFSRESLDTVINSRGPTPTNQSATPTPGLTLPPSDEYGHHSIIQTVQQVPEQWKTPSTSPPARNVWENGRKTVLRSSQPSAVPRKVTSVTFNSSVEAFTASSMGTSNTSSHEVTNQGSSGQFESMNVEMRRGRMPARLSTISQRSSISSRTSLPETEDLYCDDELRPELEHDPHMQLYTANMIDSDDEDPLQDFPHHPIFDHNDRESVLSMEIPSTGPQSLRSECNTDTGSVDGSERWAELSQGAWHLAHQQDQDQASSKVNKVKNSRQKQDLDESYLKSRDSFRGASEGDSDSTEYEEVSFDKGVEVNNNEKKVDVKCIVDKFESCIEERSDLSEKKGDRFRKFVNSLLDDCESTIDQFKSFNREETVGRVDTGWKKSENVEGTVKDSNSINENEYVGGNEEVDCGRNEVYEDVKVDRDVFLPSVGDICVARWDDDFVWYNAKIESINEDGSFNVNFIDYGNTEMVCLPCIVKSASDIPAEIPKEYIDENVHSYDKEGDQKQILADDGKENQKNVDTDWNDHQGEGVDDAWDDEESKEDKFKSIIEEGCDGNYDEEEDAGWDNQGADAGWCDDESKEDQFKSVIEDASWGDDKEKEDGWNNEDNSGWRDDSKEDQFKSVIEENSGGVADAGWGDDQEKEDGWNNDDNSGWCGDESKEDQFKSVIEEGSYENEKQTENIDAVYDDNEGYKDGWGEDNAYADRDNEGESSAWCVDESKEDQSKSVIEEISDGNENQTENIDAIYDDNDEDDVGWDENNANNAGLDNPGGWCGDESKEDQFKSAIEENEDTVYDYNEGEDAVWDDNNGNVEWESRGVYSGWVGDESKEDQFKSIIEENSGGVENEDAGWVDDQGEEDGCGDDVEEKDGWNNDDIANNDWDDRGVDSGWNGDEIDTKENDTGNVEEELVSKWNDDEKDVDDDADDGWNDEEIEEHRKFPRYRLPTDNQDEVAVCFSENPSKFYVSPVSKSAEFDEILIGCQEIPDGEVSPEVGLVCLAFFEECWYRAEVEKMSQDESMLTLFLLDYGKTIEAGVDDLKPLDMFLDIPGLVAEVGLAGIQPTGGDGHWFQEEIENFNLVVDAGGETRFLVKAEGVDQDGKVRVSMEDLEGNDITQLAMEMGVGMACQMELNRIEIADEEGGEGVWDDDETVNTVWDGEDEVGSVCKDDGDETKEENIVISVGDETDVNEDHFKSFSNEGDEREDKNITNAAEGAVNNAATLSPITVMITLGLAVMLTIISVFFRLM